MDTLIFTAATLLAVAAAVRSTWSPCGVSMLASITPLAERGRGHRYRSAALWFVTGAVVGGACLGLLNALLAAVVGALALPESALAALACVAAAVAAASDVRLGGFAVPVHHRQVNERWLDGFRPWAYGAGFGWQIGNGLSTYIKTATVYLVIVLAALTGAPWFAFAIGVLFGLVRGCAVFLGRNVTSPESLGELHRRLELWDPRSRAAVVALTLAAVTCFAWVLSPWAALVIAAGALGVTAVRAGRHPARAKTKTTTPV
jgi:hypothetical protein